MGTYKGYRGNADRVMEDAETIIDRLTNTRTTLSALCKEYQCAYPTIMRAIHSRISKDEYRAIALRKLRHNDGKRLFHKGHVPWTKGRKGIHLSPATEFKKGHLPVQYKPIGTVYIINDKRGVPYRWIKLSDRGPRQDRRKPYAQYVWEQEHGPIPPGGIIRHADGDTLNDDPGNLRLIDRATNATLNAALPGVRAKMRCNSAIASKKRWELYRKSPKVRDAAADKRHEKIARENIKALSQTVKWFQCSGCGFDADKPRPPCPKCGHLEFEKVELPTRLAANRITGTLRTA